MINKLELVVFTLCLVGCASAQEPAEALLYGYDGLCKSCQLKGQINIDTPLGKIRVPTEKIVMVRCSRRLTDEQAMAIRRAVKDLTVPDTFARAAMALRRFNCPQTLDLIVEERGKLEIEDPSAFDALVEELERTVVRPAHPDTIATEHMTLVGTIMGDSIQILDDLGIQKDVPFTEVRLITTNRGGYTPVDLPLKEDNKPQWKWSTTAFPSWMLGSFDDSGWSKSNHWQNPDGDEVLRVSANVGVAYLRRKILLPAKPGKAIITLHYKSQGGEVFVNGYGKVFEADSNRASKIDITGMLREGPNTIAIKALCHDLLCAKFSIEP